MLLVPHVYGYDAAMLLLGLWLAMFHADLQPQDSGALAIHADPVQLHAGRQTVGRPRRHCRLLAMVMALASESFVCGGSVDQSRR